MVKLDNYDQLPTTDIVVNDEATTLYLDEGCVIDMDPVDGARGLTATGPNTVVNDPSMVGIVKTMKEKDSGLCSRMSDDGDRTDRSLLDRQQDSSELEKRLTWIAHEDTSCKFTFKDVVKALLKVLAAFTLLYIFICTLDLLGNAFRLLGGKTAGSVFRDSELLKNPITGLMIGVLATVILQSSSTSSSIIITMVASNILDLGPAIFIIMGANIGTTVTNTLVSLAHSTNRREFRRAFSGAVIHDVFNWLTVIILLPMEYGTRYLYHLTKAIVDSMNLEEMKAKKQDLLKKLTKPLTSRIVMVDKKVITGIAQGKEEYANKSLLKVYCVFDKVEETVLVNKTNDNGTWQMTNETVDRKIPLEKCNSLFSSFEWSDTTAGLVLFLASVILLSLCLYCLVKILHSLLGGQIAKAARKTINADFPYPFSFLTGYVAIIVGAGMTILVQSSSVFTSALTPLVGIGCLKLERMYPLTLGSNIGTTATGILAALASSSSTMHIAVQLALCHLFFNITGILLFYPVPRMRRVVLDTAKFLGRTTAKYRWFAIAYLLGMFLVLPGFFFAISFAGKIAFMVILSCVFGLFTFIFIIKCMQRSKALRKYLPEKLTNWKFLPKCFRSLEPFDRCLQSMLMPMSQCCCQCCLSKCSCLGQSDDDEGVDSFHSESEEGTSFATTPSNLSAVSSRVLITPPKREHRSSEARIYKPSNGSSGATANHRQGNMYCKMIGAASFLTEENEKPGNGSPLILGVADITDIPSVKLRYSENENEPDNMGDTNSNIIVMKLDDLKESNI